MTLDPAVAGIVLSAASSDDFEIFAQAAMLEALGLQFEPSGGMHDGGQDGFVRPIAGKPSEYAQISIQKDSEVKIRKTIARLRDSGRDVRHLDYVTTIDIPTKDLIEDEIQKDTQVSLRIRDRKWIVLQIQRSEKLAQIFLDRFSGAVQSSAALLGHTQQTYASNERVSILSYLEAHAQSEPKTADVKNLAVDAAIFMALKDTDPDTGHYKTDIEIIEFVEAFFPSLKAEAPLLVRKRLTPLSDKKVSRDSGFTEGVDTLYRSMCAANSVENKRSWRLSKRNFV